ncbi:hypothetical protein Tco_1212382 [Tanacetum coccineum]
MRNKTTNKAHKGVSLCSYMQKWKGWQAKRFEETKSFVICQELFDKEIEMFNRAFTRVNTFVDYKNRLETAEVDDDQETANLQSLTELIPDEEEVAINAIPLAIKPPTIVDWKIHKEGKNNYYNIIRADGSSKMYRVFSQMLKSFDRQDLEDLYKLVKAKYGSTRPVEDLDLILYGDLKTMFEPHVEDQGRIVGIKRLLDDLRVTAAQRSEGEREGEWNGQKRRQERVNGSEAEIEREREWRRRGRREERERASEIEGEMMMRERRREKEGDRERGEMEREKERRREREGDR